MMNKIIEFVHTARGFVIEIISLAGALILCIDKVDELIKTIKEKSLGRWMGRLVKKIKSINNAIRCIFCIILFFLGIVIFVVRTTLPINVQITKNAWDAFYRNDYNEAIKQA